MPLYELNHVIVKEAPEHEPLVDHYLIYLL